MLKVIELETTDPSDQADLYRFFETVGDDDLLKFLRRLPIIVNDTDEPMTMQDLAYEVALWPFIKEAWTKVPGSPGLAGRIKQLKDVIELSQKELKRASGGKLVRRHPFKINLAAFLQVYSDPNDGLP